ncbi:hypothetical protein [Subtercola vilae]|uniref:Transcriptional regulator n=1 Tax=Subtercola vilae TaxID=2056433 RepID=A0A4T2BVH6_9MICO|nr:hypothetical protein [Subtercola vilae]TIH33796.1 hypothetical protein D4765_14025 [Subtercola vilae]
MAQLLRGTQITRSSLTNKLLILEKAGCITADVPEGESRVGKNLNYSVVHERVETLQQAWKSYVLSSTPPDQPLP